MSMSDHPSALKLLVAVGAVTVTSVVAFLLFREDASDSHTPERAALAELSRRFFYVCREVAQIAKTVRSKIIAEQKANISEEALKRQLRMQCKVVEKLEQIEVEVAQQFNCSLASIRSMQAKARRSSEVQAYSEGFQTMLEDALEGRLPVLPNALIPKELTKDRILEIEEEAHALECKKAAEADMAGKSYEESVNILQQAATDSWEEILALRATELVSPEVYQSALAIYLRDPGFDAEREKLTASHAKRRQKILRKGKKP